MWGLTDIEIARLTDPGRRGDADRTAGAGSGVGITIADTVATARGGYPTVTNCDHGVVVTLSLPISAGSGSSRRELLLGSIVSAARGLPAMGGPTLSPRS